jgi:hypothetical protein
MPSRDQALSHREVLPVLLLLVVTAVPLQGQTTPPQSLFEQLGGLPAISYLSLDTTAARRADERGSVKRAILQHRQYARIDTIGFPCLP